MSAQNHQAIENVMHAVCKLRAKHPNGADLMNKKTVGIAKIVGYGDKRKQPYQSVPNTPRSVGSFFKTQNAIVIGATVWAAHKCLTDQAFDVVILDEASQLIVGEATMSLMKISAEKGCHIVLAGDYKQLPPIIKRVYKIHDESLMAPAKPSNGAAGAAGAGAAVGVGAGAGVVLWWWWWL